MAITKEGLIVPDSAIPQPEEKKEVKWTAREVEAFDKAAKVLINVGVTFMAVCAECGRDGRNAVMTAYGLGDGTVMLECDCTIHILMGPKARKNAKRRERNER